MSNIGANIWTTSEAIFEPALNANVNDGGVEASAPSRTFAGNIAGAVVNANARATLEAVQPRLAVVEANGRSYTFSGNIEGGVVFANAPATLEAQAIGGYEPWVPSISGVYANARSSTVAVAYAWKYAEVDGNGRSYTFSGNIEGGVVDANAKATLETQPFGGMQTFGVVWLPGLSALPTTASDVFDGVEVVTSSVLTEQLVVLRDTVRALSAGSTLARLDLDFSDEVLVRTALLIPHSVQVLDALDTGDALDITAFKLAQIMTQVQAASGTDSVGLELLVSLASAVTLRSVADNVLSITLAEAVELLSEHSAALQTNLDALSEAHALSEADNTALLAVAVKDDALLGDEASALAWLQATVTDDVDAYVQIKVGEETIHGWVVNTELAAFSEYTNYPFNSMAEVDGVYYGLADDGLYRLDGDDDAGEPIEALLRTGLTDLGSSFLKDAKAAHIGYTSDGKLLLRVTTTAKGQKEQWWYQLKQAGAESPRDGRFTIGRGLRARYWQFEVVNVDGADFELDDIQVMYNILSRRIR